MSAANDAVRRPRARLQPRVLWRAALAVRGPLAVLALLVFVLTGSMIAGDRLVGTHTDNAYHAYLAAQPAADTDLVATSTMTAANLARLTEATARTQALLPAGLSGATGPVHTAVETQPGLWDKPEVRSARTVLLPPKLSLAASPQASSAVHYVSGAAPSCAGGCAAGTALPVAVSQSTANLLGMSVGERLTLGAGFDGAPVALPVVVSGIFTVGVSAPGIEDLGDVVRPLQTVSHPTLGPDAGMAVFQWNADVLIDPAGLGVATAWQPAVVTWHFHLLPRRLQARGATALAGQVKGLISSANQLGLGGAFADDVFSTQLAPTLAEFNAFDASAGALSDFALAGTAAIALAVLYLALRILLGTEQSALALLRARGASGAVLGAWIGFQAALVCVPAALAAAVLSSTLIPGSGHPALDLTVALLAGLGAPVSAAVLVARPPRRAASSRANRRARRVSRWIGRATALLVGVAAVAGVRMRAGAATGVDPLTALLPTILALDTALLVSILIPPLLRPAARLTGRGRGLVGYLAAAAAARRPTVDLVTAGALTAAATATVFASCFTTTLSAARVTESWQNVGADLRISVVDGSGGGALDSAQLDRIAAAPGIAAHAESTVITQQDLTVPQGQVTVTVYVIDPAQYRALVHGTPLDSPRLESELAQLAGTDGTPAAAPVLASPDLIGLMQNLPAGATSTLQLAGGVVGVSALGPAPAFPPAAGTGTYLIMSEAGVHEVLPTFDPAPTVAWYDYRPGVRNPPAAAAQVSAGAESTREEALGGYDDDLLTSLSGWISRSAAILDLVLAAACVLLAASATASARAAGSAFLLTMGTRRRAAAAVSVLETVPMLLAVGAAAVGAGYGAAEALLPAIAAIGGVPAPPAAHLPASALYAAAAVPLLGVLVSTAGAGFGREAQLSFQRTGG